MTLGLEPQTGLSLSIIAKSIRRMGRDVPIRDLLRAHARTRLEDWLWGNVVNC